LTTEQSNPSQADILGEEWLELLEGRALEELDAIERELLVHIAQGLDDREGFAAFYTLIHGNELPPHMVTTIDHIYGAKSRDHGSLIWEWRGSWKTTTISITYVVWRIGKDPNRSNLIIQANDDSANKVAQQITTLIAHHPAWKLVFPHVVPSLEEGWGRDGYYVKDDRYDVGEWTAMTSQRKDPTLLGLGIRSRSLIGKHPDGVLLLDDIHDEENTSSDRENQNVINKVTGTILPFIVEDWSKEEGQRLTTWPIAVGTPWRDDDSYHFLKNTGEFEFLSIPVAKVHMEEAPGRIWVDDNGLGMGGWYELTWPERFNPEVLTAWRRRVGKREFARMYLLDLDASKISGIKFTSYPSEIINVANWDFSGGVDFASIRTRDASTKNRDYFAMAYIAKVPTGGAVITGGVFGHYTQGMAEAHIDQIQSTFPRYSYTYVEEDGKGEGFVDILIRKPHLRIIPSRTGGHGKRLRQEKEMAPWFEVGLVRISDEDTPFLNLLRRSFENYPDGNDDVRDACYWACKSIPDVLLTPQNNDTLPDAQDNPWGRKKKKPNPFNAFGGR